MYNIVNLLPFLITVITVTFAGQEEIWIKNQEQKVYDYYTSLSNYHLFPAQNRSIHFSVKACYAVLILLSAAVDINSPDFYKVCLGCGIGYAYTYFRRKYENEILGLYTPKMINCAEHITFTLNWTVVGRITLTKDTGHGTEVVIDWTDPKPLLIQGVGIMTAWGAEGIWILEHIPVFTGHFCGEQGTYGNMTLLNIVMHPSKIRCVLECSSNDACFGVNFNANTSQCHFLAERQLIVKSFAQDWNFYIKCLAGTKMCLACLDI